jgi:uncharacterized protein GlcG (DUF336 family)
VQQCHVISPPEWLEPRNAPGACWLLPPLVDFSTGDAANADCFDAWTAEAAREATGHKSDADGSSATRHSAAGKSRSDSPRVTPDWLNLLGGESGTDGDLRRSADSARRPEKSSTRVGGDELASLTFAPAHEIDAPVAARIVPVVETHRSARSEPLTVEPPPVLKQSTLPAAAPAVVSGTGGGGSSGLASGGARAAGGHAALPATAPTPTAFVAPVATARVTPVVHVSAPTSAAAPLVSSTSTTARAPSTAAASSAGVLEFHAPPMVSIEAIDAAIVTALDNVQTTAQPPTSASQSTAAKPVQTSQLPTILANGPVVTAAEVEQLLDRAAAATSRSDAIIAVVDRNGQILGVRVEANVPIAPADTATLVFAIDGAVAKARTAAFFSNNQAPLTSRTVRFISQTTITEREVASNPNLGDPTSTLQGPGFVGPIGLGGHFPPGVMFTPHVDLFAIEHTNRDSITHVGADRIRGTGDDIDLGTRFGADFAAGQDVPAPESYGLVSGMLPDAQARGVATLPGGIPLFKIDPADNNRPKLVGGIGVFFPGPDGFATFEQDFQHADDRAALGLKPQTTNERLNAPLVLEAEYTAFAAAGGEGMIAGIAPVAGFVVPRGRIDLVGITLEIYGPHPHGEKGLVAFGRGLGTGTPDGTDMPVNAGGDLFIDGQSVPDGWLVDPVDAADGSLSADEVRQIIEDGIAEANLVRSAIRLPLGQRSRMVLSVTDTNGEVLGLFRMPDATFFSIDVAVAKARNVAYYADPAAIQNVDRVDGNLDGTPDVAAGVAFTNRTFRYLATTYFPTGVDTAPPGPFSILNDPGINPQTAENLGAALPANQYTSVLGFDSFNPGTNFREGNDPAAVIGNQNGIVFFPGSTPLYKNGVLVGGLGVSGDGVDQDDVVTFSGGGDFLPGRDSGVVRADQTIVNGVRLPYQKFLRNPRG